MTALPDGISQGASRRTIIAILGVTQIFAWGSSYYLPAVIAPAVASETGWPLAWVVGGLSLGLLVAGLISPRVGTLIDRNGGRTVMAFSAACIGLGQIGLAAAPNLAVFIAAWLVIGLGMGAGLYDAAFATLGRLYGVNARSAIGALTLFGGFASTICWPLSALLLSHLGWRGVCLVYAGIQLLVALPLYLAFLPGKATPGPVRATGLDATAPTAYGRSALPIKIVLGATLTLAAVISSTVSVHLLTILQAGGLALAAAVSLGALVGPSQVAARSVELVIARHHHPIWTKVVSTLSVAIGISMLWAGVPILPLALAFYGAGIGLDSIARGTLPLALFGAHGYARLMGRLALPSLMAQAAAPYAAALLMEGIGAHGTMTVLAGFALVNLAMVGLLFAMVRRRGRQAG